MANGELYPDHLALTSFSKKKKKKFLSTCESDSRSVFHTHPKQGPIAEIKPQSKLHNFG